MSENIQMICKINNRTTHTLKRQEVHLDWGKFDDPPNLYPVEAINPRSSVDPAFRSSGKQGSSSGTQGYVKYNFDGNTSQWIKIYWDIPWASGASNIVKTESFDENVAVSLSGYNGSGSVESVTVTIVDGR